MGCHIRSLEISQPLYQSRSQTSRVSPLSSRFFLAQPAAVEQSAQHIQNAAVFQGELAARLAKAHFVDFVVHDKKTGIGPL